MNAVTLKPWFWDRAHIAERKTYSHHASLSMQRVFCKIIGISWSNSGCDLGVTRQKDAMKQGKDR